MAIIKKCFCCGGQLRIFGTRTVGECDCTRSGLRPWWCPKCERCIAHCSCEAGPVPFVVGDERKVG